MEKKNILGVCIFAGLLAIAIALPLAVKNYTDSARNVTVKGLCEMEVEANRAIWPIVFKETGNSLSALAATVQNKNGIVLNWLKSVGFTDEEITVSAPKIENLAANGYMEHRSFDYVFTSAITVCSNDVKKVVEMQQRQFDLLGKGIAIGSGNTWDYPVVYEYTSLNDVKAEMIEKAIINAREAAQKFAKDSGSRLGKINTATQGQFSITDRDANTPYIKIIRVVSTVNYALR